MTFDDLLFGGHDCWLMALGGASFKDFLAVAIVVGLDPGVRSIRDVTGALAGATENWPLAIWRARSFTLTNILAV